MKVVIIDNQDSFTYNLAHYVQHFTHSVDVFRVNEIDIKKLFLTGQDMLTVGVTGALFSGVVTTSAIMNKNLIKELLMK